MPKTSDRDKRLKFCTDFKLSKSCILCIFVPLQPRKNEDELLRKLVPKIIKEMILKENSLADDRSI